MEIEKEQSLAVPSPSNSLGTILLVDDDDRVREVVEAMLQQLGARVMTANNGVEGIALYKKHITKINLVIIDMNMPQMNGAQAIAKLKQINSECTFIAITGFSEIQILTQLDEQEIPIILKKPFSFAQLTNAVHSIL